MNQVLNLDTPYADEIDEVRGEYFRWLSHRVGLNFHEGHSFWVLAKKLHQKDFYAVVEGDEHRIQDAKVMRRWWVNDFCLSESLSMPEPPHSRLWTGYVPRDSLDGPATILEVLVAMARRIEDEIMQDDHEGDRTEQWFWVMMKNLGLHTCSDDACCIEKCDQIDTALDRMLERSYDAKGRGGLWPVQFSKADQRKVEVWMQMSAWFNENVAL